MKKDEVIDLQNSMFRFRTDLEEMKRSIEDGMNEITLALQKIGDIDECCKKTPVFIDPEYCLHVNRTKDDKPNAIIETCDDCGLLLSFRHI